MLINKEKNQKYNNVLHRIILFFATGFYSGYLPWAPGTWGTLAAVPIYFCLRLLPLWLYAVILAIMIVAGFYLCGYAAKAMNKEDPPEAVWDEVVGFLLVMLFLPYSILSVIIGFALFRLFDIWKPWPIKKIEDLPGGFGIILDDLMASVYAILVAWIIIIVAANL
jgi:phosphatidylglycerophosphatase A